MGHERQGTTFPPQPLSEADAPERIECVCSRAPLLARAGRWKGKPFLWVKHNKARVDLLVVGGITKIKCRECNRYHTIRIGTTIESEID